MFQKNAIITSVIGTIIGLVVLQMLGVVSGKAFDTSRIVRR